MALISLSPPDGAVSELRKNLAIIAQLADTQTESPIFPSVYKFMPKQKDAYPIFFLGLRELAKDASFKDALVLGWRFLLAYEQNVIACANVYFDKQSATYHFGEIGSNSICADNDSVFELQKADVAHSIQQYEARILSIPSLHSEFFWLAGNGIQDIFIPLAPIPDFWANDQPRYMSAELMHRLKLAAKKQIKTSTSQSS